MLKTYVHARDYIITSLILSNASRLGSVRNMTLSQFRATNTDENRLYIVSVTDHKTAASSGPTTIVFTPELYHECRIFVQKIRNVLAGALISGESFVFLAGRGIRCHRRCWEISFLAFWEKLLKPTLLKGK